MIALNRQGKEDTAADRLATDAAARAIERVQKAVRESKARLELKLSEAIAEVLEPAKRLLESLEERVGEIGHDQ